MNEFRVALIRKSSNSIDAASWVYRGDSLPAEGDVIEVAIDTVPDGGQAVLGMKTQAGVTSVAAERDPPIHANEI